jgi:hypothetical protein
MQAAQHALHRPIEFPLHQHHWGPLENGADSAAPAPPFNR